MRRIVVMLLLLFTTIALTGCGLWPRTTDLETGDGEPPRAAGPQYPYSVRFEGQLDSEIETAITAASRSRQLTERPPADRLGLERRAEADLEHLREALRGLGYYDPRVTHRIDQAPSAPAAAAEPGGAQPSTEQGSAARSAAVFRAQPTATLVFIVEPGPRYTFDQREIRLVGQTNGFNAPRPGQLGLERGEPAIAQRVLDAEAKLLERARKAGHPLARADQREAVVDHNRRVMDVTLVLAPGPRAEIGRIEFEGGEDIDKRYLKRRSGLREGEQYDPEKIEQGRNALAESGLFTAVTVQLGSELDAQGRIPVTYQLVQRKHRSIGVGLGYRTDEGINADVFWEHRNILGAGERLRLEVAGSVLRQTASAAFRKPEFLARRQSLLAEFNLKQENLDAFESSSVGSAVGLEREFRKNLTGSLGVAYRFAQVEDRRGREVIGLASLPARLNWDFSNDLLDPSRGGRLSFDLGPYFNTLDPGTRFFKGRVIHTRYFPLMNSPRLVLAARGAAGTILGADREEVPADERFYAGGGGSIRGIPFQLAGPIDRKRRAVGGTSFVELASEVRLGITSDIGVVAFIDGGAAYDSAVPRLANDLRWGTGLGVRYATPIGPLRLDVGVPIDKKSEIDDTVQIYLSIGQAF